MGSIGVVRGICHALVGVGVVGLMSMLGCGGSDGPKRYELSDGTRVEVDANGGVALRTAEGRALAGLAPRGPVLRRFEPNVRMLQGFFTFRRRELEEVVLDRFEGSRLEDGRVVLRWASSTDDATARTIVEVNEAGVTTRLRVEADWAGSEEREVAYAVPFACDAEASFSGFGAQYNQTDQRGEVFELWVQEQGLARTGLSPFTGDEHTTYFPMPWWLDWRGFGVLVDTHAKVNADLCATDADVAWLEVEHRRPGQSGEETAFEALVFHGPSARDVVRQLGDRVGRPQRPPEWAFSPWIAIQGGSDAVRDEVARLRAADVPFSAVWVQDWIGGKVIVGDVYDLTYRWVADEALYPDLAGLVSELRADDLRFLGYANSFVIDGLDHYDEMAAMGLLPRDPEGATYRFGITVSDGSVADFTNPATDAYVLGYLRAMVRDLGFDGWMADFGEWLPYDAQIFAGDPALVHNDYPRLWHRLNEQVMNEERPDGDWVVFSRSGWTGDQSAQQIVWIGDQEADWEPTDGLPTVLPAILNLGLLAVPLRDPTSQATAVVRLEKELFARWIRLEAPISTTFMRTHEGLAALANWGWDSDARDHAHFRHFARIHEALVPGCSRRSRTKARRLRCPDAPPRAGVPHDDVQSRAQSGSPSLLGDDLLVAPVIEEARALARGLLPPGTWFRTCGRRDARRQPGLITIDAPIGEPPVFSRGTDRADLRPVVGVSTPVGEVTSTKSGSCEAAMTRSADSAS
ncbi:MAG: hypothetical protein H6724_12245 [Sandaracinus sp.]|nr:hypothetical protein [Sandaracinus sp.]